MTQTIVAQKQSKLHPDKKKHFPHLGKLSKLGPVVQSVVSLTSLLRAISLTILADSVYNFLNFFAEKM